MQSPTINPTMDLEALRIFVKVAELASFSRAAEQLGLPKARVSLAVQQLEAQLATRLLQRTTRTVRLTPDGTQVLQQGLQLLADAEELHTLFHGRHTALRGRLRVDMPTVVARKVVVPRLGEFLAAHPLLQIELSSSDRRVDLVQEGFDCVVRIGTLVDSDLVARPLGRLQLVTCASPAYLQRHGTPLTLADLDLQQHRVVHYAPTLGTPAHEAAAPGAARSGLDYVDADGVPRLHALPCAITVNNTESYQAACVAGLGLVQVPLNGVAQLLAQGALMQVLPAWLPAAMPVSLVYPHRRHLAKRVQAFMDWLAGVMEAYLDGPGHGG